VVGWLEGRVVRMFLGSYRGDGRTRYYIARRARPMLIHRYEPRLYRTKPSLTESAIEYLRSLSNRLMSLTIVLLRVLAGLKLRNLLAKGGCVGVRPPRYLPDWVKNLDVPL